MALVLGALSVGSEYGWHTLKLALTQRPGRLSFLCGKFLAVGAVLAVVTLLALLASAASSYAVAMLQGGPTNWPLPAEVLKGFAAGWLILVAFAALGFFLAILLKGSAPAIAIGLLYALVVQDLFLPLASFQSETAARFSRVLPGRNAGDLAGYFGGSRQAAQASGLPPGLEPVDPSQAALVLAAYVVIFLSTSMLLFWRRDVA